MTPEQQAAMRQMIEALSLTYTTVPTKHLDLGMLDDAIRAGKAALEQQQTGIKQVIELYDSPEQQPAEEPVAWKVDVDLQNFQGQSEYRTILAWNAKPVWTGTHEINEVLKAVPLYTRPQPAAQWVGLTDEEIALVCAECAASAHRHDDISYARAIEAKLKEKNT